MRILAGRAVGLVLGGGGARGFAHLGVLRALEELGVRVDMIGGTSIGAPLAHLPAQGRDAAECLAVIRSAFRSLFDYTLPIASLLAGYRTTKSIERYARPWNIEDLWLPYYCVSTNITTAQEVIHRRGDLARAVRASVAIPGVFPPVPEGNDLLVDGGVLNNLPIDIMRKINPSGPVIAVDVVPQQGLRARSDYGLGLSGWPIVLGRIIPWQKTQVPSLGATIASSMVIGSQRKRERMRHDGLADLYVSIKASRIRMLQFDAVEEVAKIGYQSSIEPLRQWVESGGLGDPSATVSEAKMIYPRAAT